MKFTIIGAGAIGGVIGSYLVKGGEDVTFVDIDKDHVEKMNTDGLTIESKDNVFTVPVKALTLEELVKREVKLDVVFLCVKALHTKDAVNQFQHLLNEHSIVVSFQNGLCEQDIAAIIGEERTVGCFVNLFADYIRPGYIHYGGVGAVYIGELNKDITPRVEEIVNRLKVWGDAKATDNIEGYLWGKLAYGAILTATALTNEKIADILDSHQYRDMLIELAREVLEVAHLEGIKPEGFDNWEPGLLYPKETAKLDDINRQFDTLVSHLRNYTKTRTGIWRDLAVRKRKTEVPYHLEPIIAKGHKKHVRMGLTETTLRMIKDIEDGKRDLSIENLDLLNGVYLEKKNVYS
ncbi:ketopantoate reductase family protein [Salirhabdus salicampi]|uniref:ketopantoate reductase family protein n=1 Tax=Salirhabdus salicampi TaxID=476102 RepID=UPI0020C3FA25|nr:2-dehydropantoate 2-reductase [Salirhabdus salicampi]MCP8615710.1 2-dehydropantoate 2-reductase [Salirhabdus salicampi]